jgi:hypothetical protein
MALSLFMDLQLFMFDTEEMIAMFGEVLIRWQHLSGPVLSK